MPELPLITVLLPVYNGEKYVGEALESILAQTCPGFELLAFDDGSTDRSGEILEGYQSQDPRVRVIHQENRGLIATLNSGLGLARGKYIARMDADDVSLPTRFARQVAFLEAHPEVGVCGTWVKTITPNGGWVRRFPTDPGELRAWLLFSPPLAHPSAMLRREILEKHEIRYSLAYWHVEDYGLWLDLARVADLANVPEVLLHYRLHGEQTGVINEDLLRAYSRRIWLEQLEGLGLHPTRDDLGLHEAASMGGFPATRSLLDHLDAWLRGLGEANRQKKVFVEEALLKVLGVHWFGACQRSTSLGIWTWQRFWRSTLSRAAHVPPDRLVKFTLKCWVGAG